MCMMAGAARKGLVVVGISLQLLSSVLLESASAFTLRKEGVPIRCMELLSVSKVSSGVLEALK